MNIDGPSFPSDVVCPNATAIAAFEAAVRRGDITWHAFPFNAELEVHPNHRSPVLFYQTSAMRLGDCERTVTIRRTPRTMSCSIGLVRALLV